MKRIFWCLCLAVTAVSCSERFDEKGAEAVSPAAGKILHTRAGADEGSFLVKFASKPDDEMLRSLETESIIAVRPLFSHNPSKGEMEARFGLDRWYEVVTGGDGLEGSVSRMAESPKVELVEYNLIMRKASDCKVYPLSQSADDLDAATRAGRVFNDPYLSKLWNMKNEGNKSIASTAYKGGDINVYDVWSGITAGDASIVVAVVDEGVKYNHPDLAANMWRNEAEINGTDGVDDDGNGFVDDKYGYNFVSGGPVTWDKKMDSGHGTHCAGIISAVNNNGTGISSVAGGTGHGDGVKIMSCQIFDGNEGGTESVIVNAIKYAADNGASVISGSFGYSGTLFKSDKDFREKLGVVCDVIDYFSATSNNGVLDGGVAVFAAGNSGESFAEYPGALANMISVSAFAPDFLPTYYTNYGPGCNIVAPGGEDGLAPFTSYAALILSTIPKELYGEDYGYMQGTSMACPHVSGIAALGIAYAKKLGKKMTVQEFKDMLLTSANDFDSRIIGSKKYVNRADLELYPYRGVMGTGSIDTWTFMMKMEGTPCLIAKYGENQWLDLSSYFGTASTNLTYLGVEISDADRAAIGLASDPYIEYGRLFIHPTKVGSAKLKVKAIGGGDALGGDERIGGMEISQEVSVVVRAFKSDNGGWL